MSGKTPLVFEVDPSGEILDRLVGLHQFIPPERIRQAVDEAGRRNRCDCRLTHEVRLWVVLARGILTDLPLGQVFKHARRRRHDEESPPRNTLWVARRRLGVGPVRPLFDSVVRPLATPQTPEAFYKGLRRVGIDGTTFELPDAPANANAFGRPGGCRADGAFPPVRKLSLVERGTHGELAFVLKPSGRGEVNRVAGLRRHLRPGLLLLWDRGFFSYPLGKSVVARGGQLLARVSCRQVLKPVQELVDRSYLAKLSPSSYDRDKDRKGVLVRVIKYTRDDPQRVGHGQEHTLSTTLRDAVAHPAVGLILLYQERWEEERTFDEQKTHQDPPRPGKPTQLRSETPPGVVQEVYALSLGHYLTRALMARAAARAKRDPDRLSLVGCLRILRCRLPECDSRAPQTWQPW
jgi:transposase IS4-like protein/DDE family transposase